MIDETARQEIVDAEHLRLLRIGYFIAAGTNVIWVFFPLIYAGLGAMILSGVLRDAKAPPPEGLGMLLIVIGCTVSFACAVLTLLKILTARALGRRRSKVLILITAVICCFGIPWGTALGVFTLMVINRPSVATQFNRAQ